MMYDFKKIKDSGGLLFILILILYISFVKSQPQLPHQFYGYVNCNGNSVPNGIEVSSYNNNIKFSSTSVLDGRYGYSPAFLLYNINEGASIEFYVGNNKVAESRFIPGGVTQLNLVLSSCDLIYREQGSNNGGSGSGGGGGGSSPKKTTNVQKVCSEKWECSAWSNCINSKRSRTCTDSNNCNTTTSKPSIKGVCYQIGEEINNQSSQNNQKVFKRSENQLIIPLGASLIAMIIFAFILMASFVRKSKNI